MKEKCKIWPKFQCLQHSPTESSSSGEQPHDHRYRLFPLEAEVSQPQHPAHTVNATHYKAQLKSPCYSQPII